MLPSAIQEDRAVTSATRSARADELDRCRGSLVLHASGAVECTDRDCADLARARHEFAVACGDVAPPCGCVE